MTLTEFHPTYFRVEPRNGCVVLTFVVTKLSEEDNLEQLSHDMLALVDQYQVRRLVVNLAEVEYLTSAVLGKLITLHRRLHRKDGRLAVCGAKDTVEDVFRATRLDEYFAMTPDVTTAVTQLGDD